MATFISIILVNPVSITQFSQRSLLESMWDAQGNYQWTLNGTAPSPDRFAHQSLAVMRDTRAWNQMQSQGCCGIDGYDDWNRVRPNYMQADSLPYSCCPGSHVSQDQNGSLLCTPASSYRLGCRQLFERLEAQRNKITMLIGLMQIVISILFYMIEHQSDPDQPPPQVVSDHTSLVNMQNAMKQRPPVLNGYGTYNIAPDPQYATMSPPAFDTVLVDENTPYKSSARK